MAHLCTCSILHQFWLNFLSKTISKYLLYKKQKALVLIWVDRSRWKRGVSIHYLNTLLIYTVNIHCLISAFKKEQTNRVILKKIIYNYYEKFNLESFLLEFELRNHLEKEKLSSDKKSRISNASVFSSSKQTYSFE